MGVGRGEWGTGEGGRCLEPIGGRLAVGDGGGALYPARLPCQVSAATTICFEFVKAVRRTLGSHTHALVSSQLSTSFACWASPQGIQAHPWFTAPLPEDLEAALALQAEEQALRDGLRRAAVSTAAGRHDTANNAGEFATIDLLVEMATTYRCAAAERERGGGCGSRQGVFGGRGVLREGGRVCWARCGGKQGVLRGGAKVCWRRQAGCGGRGGGGRVCRERGGGGCMKRGKMGCASGTALTLQTPPPNTRHSISFPCTCSCGG